MRRPRPRPVRVPQGWTPSAASATIALLERIADAIWDDYGDAIWAWRDQEREGASSSTGGAVADDAAPRVVDARRGTADR